MMYSIFQRLPFLLGVIALCFSAPVHAAEGDSLTQQYFTPENILRFADYLYSEGDFRRAAWEYERYLYHSRTSNDSMAFLVAGCYERDKELQKAFVRYSGLAALTRSPQWKSEALYRAAAVEYKQQHYAEAFQRTQQSLQGQQILPAHRLRASLLNSVAAIASHRWEEGERVLKELRQNPTAKEQTEIIDSLSLIVEAYRSLPKKSPWLAGIFSAIVPGTGKIYAGQFLDGIYSLLGIGTTAWAAYDGFATDGSSSARGWFFGALSASLYLGNIYGSALSATIINNENENQYVLRIQMKFEELGLP